MIPRIAPFISATYGSRTPKSVVSVTMASNPSDRRPSAVPIHDEVRHERERLALLRRREDLEVGLRGPRVGVGPRARVLDALVLDDQPADLLELRRDQGRTPEERADALRLRRYQPPEHRDQRECPLSLAQVRADRLAETVLVRDEVERVVRDLERDPDVEPVTGERLDLVGRETAEQRADPAARGHERGRLLRDDAEVVGLRREAVPLALELEDLGFRHRHRDRKSTRLNSSHGYISYAVFCLKKKNIISPDRSRCFSTVTARRLKPRSERCRRRERFTGAG